MSNSPQEAKAFLVASLPGLKDSDLKALGPMHAGLLPVIGKDNADLGSLFFWMFSARTKQKTSKLVFWLNGGPGCSSMDGLFLENGPFIPTADGNILIRESSWTHHATVVYVDQPVGTGYSTLGKSKRYTQSLTEVAASFRPFLDRFFETFPDLKASDVYIAGESYAGQYLPYIANNIISVPGKFNINLKGMLIGNGWIDPQRQYLSFVEYGKQNNILSGPYLESAIKSSNTCKDKYQSTKQDKIKSDSCEGIMDAILNNSTASGETYCLNMYDIRLFDDTAEGACGLYSWPPHLNEMKKYLGRSDVKTAVHVPNAGGGQENETWEECDGAVNDHLGVNPDAPSYTLLPALLEKIPILLFNGDKDLVCNWIGLYDMVESMTWNGSLGMNNVTKQDWYINSELQGWYQTAKNLTFVVKYNASHMMPVDSPVASSDLFNRFIGVDVFDPVDKKTVGKLVDAKSAIVPSGGGGGGLVLATTKLEKVTAVPFITAGIEDYLEGGGGGYADGDSSADADIGTSESFGSGAFFLLLIIVSVMGYLLYRSNRARFSSLFLRRSSQRRTVVVGTRTHDWMELNTVDGRDDEDDGSAMGDDELDAMLELESGPSLNTRKRA
ncbi:Alpha/Beta hydrolase protein [Obelidium mucronatum]|nr:Alpha/Beta hydrolase protein [Obelidium mucronatum]